MHKSFELKAGAAQHFVKQNLYEQIWVSKQTWLNLSSQRSYVMQNAMQGHSAQYGIWPNLESIFLC